MVSILYGSGEQDEVSFSPDDIIVVIGVNSSVTWVNNDIAPHTVTAYDGSFSSGNMSPGATFTFNFTSPGVHRYYCIYHTWMVGSVTVKAP